MHRRTFLQSGFMFAASGLGTLAPSFRIRAAGMPFTDRKALVCIFLYGGNDSFNLIVPRSAAEYSMYASSRQNLAVARESLLPLQPATADGAQYGMHASVPELAALFESGSAAVIANVGTLIRPTTRAEILAGTAPLPPQLFSHNDQQSQWQTLAGLNVLTGWAGRMGDVLAAGESAQSIPFNVSLAGDSIMQAGDASGAYVMSTDGAPTFAVFDADVPFGQTRRQVFESLLARSFASPIASEHARVQQRSLQLADTVNAALESAPVLSTPFPSSPLGDQLKEIARVIAARDSLDARRQVFFAAIGGFDTHDDQVVLQPKLFADLSASLDAFASALQEIGAWNDVVTFTQSDFGRTLTSNGDGTDHGWGGHQIVLGGAVRGRDIYGRMPQLEIDGPDDVTGGRIIPAQSADQYVATLARWFGLSSAQIDVVVPNLRNFPERDLGFLI